MRAAFALALLLAAPALAQEANPRADAIGEGRLDTMRVLGSHNSYRPALSPAALAEQRRILREQSAGVEYGHVPIAAQLDLGLRQLEFDPLADPDGGLFAAPYVGDRAAYAAMRRPGPKVLHVPFVDRHTLCLTLADCFTQVARWSRAHPGHHPIVLTINPSDGPSENPLMPMLMPFDERTLATVDAQARAIFGRALLTPDAVRGRFATLGQAVRHGGWPKLAQARGRIMLVLDASDSVLAAYARGHAALRGRAMFGFYPESAPEAAFLNIQDARGQEARIAGLVREGLIVRTRADSETVEARAHDHGRLDAALRSGAQIISTDYYAGAPDPLGLGFVQRLAP